MKKNDEYFLIKTLKTEIDVEFIIQIKPDLLILFEKDFKPGPGCKSGHYSHYISLYNINSEEETNIYDYPDVNRLKPELNILIKNNYLLDRYNDFFNINNIEQNMKKISTDYMNKEKDYFNLNDCMLKKK